MYETETYRLLLEEGAVRQARHLILMQGEQLIGPATEKQKNKLSEIEDLERLKRRGMKVLTAKTWDALLRVQ